MLNYIILSYCAVLADISLMLIFKLDELRNHPVAEIVNINYIIIGVSVFLFILAPVFFPIMFMTNIYILTKYIYGKIKLKLQ